MSQHKITDSVICILTIARLACIVEAEMEACFRNKDLDRLETDPKFDGGYPQSIVKMFRKRMQTIRAAEDERVFYALKSLHFEQLQGLRSGQYSMKLNDQWRLVLQFEGSSPDKVVLVLSIEDYH